MASTKITSRIEPCLRRPSHHGSCLVFSQGPIEHQSYLVFGNHFPFDSPLIASNLYFEVGHHAPKSHNQPAPSIAHEKAHL